MYGWCDKCEAIALEGMCSEHGATKPISMINSVDLRPLTKLEKQLLNDRMERMELGNGIFAVYGDRVYRRKIVTLDRPLVEVKLTNDGQLAVNQLATGKIEGMNIGSIFNANRDRIERLTETVKSFSRWELESSERAIISFSGGKDSTVLSHLLSEFKLRNVFIDTTIEFPETYMFIRQLQTQGWNIEIAKAKRSFFALLKENGYPKYDNRWCCKTQKFEPFRRYIDEHFGEEPILVFSAERRCEALSRLDQPLRKKHKYIPNQNTIQPLLDWLTMDIWIYTWKNRLPINELYGYYDRGGCWTCPFGLRYRIFLMKCAHPKLYGVLEKVGLTSRAIVKKKPCAMNVGGRVVKTCDVYGHFYKNGSCFRCGSPAPLSEVLQPAVATSPQ